MTVFKSTGGEKPIVKKILKIDQFFVLMYIVAILLPPVGHADILLNLCIPPASVDVFCPTHYPTNS